MIDSFDRLRLADPAPRGAEPPESVLTLEALLVDIDERVGYMPVDTQERMTAPRDSRESTRRGWLTAVVAFGMVLIFGAITVVMMNQETGIPPAITEETPTTQALSSEEQAKIDAAHAAVATFNEGDISAWVNSFREGSTFAGRQVSSTSVRDMIAFRMALGEEISVQQCAIQDDGKVRCDLVSVDGLGLSASGINEFDWIVDSDNGRLLAVDETGNLEWRRSVTVMGNWVSDAHPDIWASSLEPASGTCSPPGGSKNGGYYGSFNCVGQWQATPASASALLGLIDEYKAQLDK